MPGKPLVSIVTPSFNQGRYITETIKSVLAQTYENIEYIVIDGGSSDETIDILRKYESDGLKWLSEPDEGQSDAIQKGFEKARGEIIGWLNSDDVLLPTTVEKVVRAFDGVPDIGLVYGDLLLIDQEGSPITSCSSGPLSLKRLFTKNQQVLQAGSFYRRHYVEQAGGIDKKLTFVMDYDLFIRLLRISKGVYLPETVAKFRLHPQSKSSTLVPTLGAIEAFRVSRRWGGPLLCHLNFQRASNLLKGVTKMALGMPAVNVAKLRKQAAMRGRLGA
jgi:glycosyltransferase involved in cell wall biosynthesis